MREDPSGSPARGRSCSSSPRIAEIGGAWLIWQGVREQRGWIWMGAGVVALGVYGFVATLQPDAAFGRILAAYGGIFVAGSLLWGVALDGFRPDRWDTTGSAVESTGRRVARRYGEAGASLTCEGGLPTGSGRGR
jgi:small multidrug resistance family-3 protein